MMGDNKFYGVITYLIIILYDSKLIIVDIMIYFVGIFENEVYFYIGEHDLAYS